MVHSAAPPIPIMELREQLVRDRLPRLSTTLKSKRSAQARMAEGVKMEVRQGQDAKAAWLTTAARQARPILKAF